MKTLHKESNESKVLAAAICTHRNSQDAADFLGIKYNTIRDRLTWLYRKLDVCNKQGLIDWAIENHIVDASQVISMAYVRRYRPADDKAMIFAVVTNIDIRSAAQAMSVSRRTVQKSLARLYAKLDVDGRDGLILWALDNGVVKQSQVVRRIAYSQDPIGPTPDEIQQRIAEVQAGWSRRKRRSRQAGRSRRLLVPTCRVVVD